MSNTPFGPPLSSLDPAQTFQSASTGGLLSTDAYGQPGAMWVDPSVNVNGAMPMDLGMSAIAAHNVGFAPVDNGFVQPQNGMMGTGMGGQWGDGNSSQYWNNLVDRESTDRLWLDPCANEERHFCKCPAEVPC
jgi:hypothetical protein